MSDQKPVKLPDPATPVELSPVNSSQIAAIGHNANANVLAIRFKGKGDAPGSLYFYAGVDAELFAKFRAAESVGTFFGAHIKNAAARHPYVKIVEKKD